MSDDAAGTAPEKTTGDLEALADKLRSRVDWFGKALAAIATLGTGAVGLNTVADLAPRGWWGWVASLLALVALCGAAWCAVRIAGSLMQVNQPVVLDVDDDALDLTDAERDDVEQIYGAVAQRYGLSSLQGLAERERALRKAAGRAGSDDERARRTALADGARADIDHAIARARWAVVRRRASEAAGGRKAQTAYLGVAAGLLAFAFLADVATSRQSDDIATAKACGEAREAGATGEDFDHTVCDKGTKDDGGDDEDDPPPTAEEARAALVTTLVEALNDCTALARSVTATEAADDRPLDDADCAAVRTAIAALLGGDSTSPAPKGVQ